MKRINLTGKRFGRLLIQEYSHTNKHRKAVWKCLCQCGKTVIVNGSSLRNGRTKSCGCFRSERSMEANIKHGLSKSRLYSVWALMKDRCLRKKSNAYKNYGGRGISICEEWLGFKPFMEWALTNGYQENLTIERKDNNDNYCPENCTWILKSEQAKNSRNLKFIIFNGEKKFLAEWAKIIGIDRRTISARLKRGWSIKKALTTLNNKKEVTSNG